MNTLTCADVRYNLHYEGSRATVADCIELLRQRRLDAEKKAVLAFLRLLPAELGAVELYQSLQGNDDELAVSIWL